MSKPSVHPPEPSAADRVLEELRARQRRVLFVDDEPLLRRSVKRSLERSGHEVQVASGGEEALRLLESASPPDVIMTDQRMPGMTGVELLSAVRETWPDIVRVCVSGHADRPEILDAINRGQIFRFMMKPWTLDELIATVSASLREADLIVENRLLQGLLAEHNERLLRVNIDLEALVEARTKEVIEQRSQLDAALGRTVEALVLAIEAKDEYTRGHSDNVARYALRLAEAIGLGQEETQSLRFGCLLHDVGKLAVPEPILLKAGRLTADEFHAMRRHPTYGYSILEKIDFPADVSSVIRHHHERYDGEGYPDGLRGEQIPLLARIAHVADVYDALRSDRVYRKAWSKERVVAFLRDGIGADFDPNLAQVFIEMIDDGRAEQPCRAETAYPWPPLVAK